MEEPEGKHTVVIFFPFDLRNLNRSYLYGDYDAFKRNVTIFFTTEVLHHTYQGKTCEAIFGDLCDGTRTTKDTNNWMFVDVHEGQLTLRRIRMDGVDRDPGEFHLLWINYNFKVFSLCEYPCSDDALNPYCRNSYFRHLKDKISERIAIEKGRNVTYVGNVANAVLTFMIILVIKMSNMSQRLLPFTKYIHILKHVNHFLIASMWALKSVKERRMIDIKVTNFLVSIALDMSLGILFLAWLNSRVSLDSSADLFLLTAETIVNSIKNLINWLKGDPAGLKLNLYFNNILATFFSFHIDIWWTFLVHLKPAVTIIFQIFLKLGLLGITFQASIAADLLVLVSFHVYCIHAYAAKLYNIQTATLISLWRLFLGRKMNPLRGKVDSCRYTPEQLFVGTLAFTILLFLLPTTILYYVVFTSIKLLILVLKVILMLVHYLSQTLPIYTSFLWLTRSPKIFSGIELTYCDDVVESEFLLLNVKPVVCNWWNTVAYFKPDSAVKSPEFHLTAFLHSLLTGKRKIPLADL